MTILWKQLFQLVKLLNSEKGTHQIALGVALGFVLGMTPSFSLQTLVVFAILLLFRIQLGAALASAFFFKFIAYALDPVFHSVGDKVLRMESLQNLFAQLYNMPIVPLTRFYNTIVMGSGVVAFCLTPVIYGVALVLLSKYREHIFSRIKNSKFIKVLKASTLYNWYKKYDDYT